MKKMILEYLAVGGASALGGMFRLFVARLFPWSAFPVGTLIINVTGSLFLGWFLTVVGDRVIVSEYARLAIAVGFVGAYTTFSTYMYESDKLIQDGAGLEAIVYLMGSMMMGLMAVRLGVFVGHRM